MNDRLSRLGCLAGAVLLVLALTPPLMAEEKKDAGGGGAPQGPPPALVRVGEARVMMLQQRWEVVGRLQQVRHAVVASEQEGRVVEIGVDTGDRVQAGKTVLARIDDIWTRMDLAAAESRLAEAEAAVKEAQAAVDQGRRNQTYLEELAKVSSAKPKEVQDAMSTTEGALARFEAANAAVRSAQAQLTRARTAADRVVIVAPFDGIVVRKMTELGQWLTPGSAVAEIVSVSQIDAVIDAPERLIGSVAVGEEVPVVIEPLDVEVVGKVVAVSPMGSSAARTFPVKIRLDDQGGKLLSGMSVLARVPSGPEREMLTVPRDAVLRTELGANVWADLNGVGMPVPVRVLFGSGDRFAVQAIEGAGPPLMPGMKVVIEGAERLFPGRPLMVPPGPSTPPAAEAEKSPAPVPSK